MNLRLAFKSGAVITIPLKSKLRTSAGVPYDEDNPWAALCIRSLGTGAGTAQMRRAVNGVPDLVAFGLKVEDVVYWDVS